MGRRDRRRRLAEHRRDRRDRAAACHAGRGPRLEGLQRAAELRRRDRLATTGSSRSMPTSACRRRSRPKSSRSCAAARRRTATACRASRSISGRWITRHRLVSRLSAAPLRSPRRAVQRQARPRVGRALGRQARARCATICSTIPIATSPTTSPASITTRRSPPRSGSPPDAGPIRSTSCCTRRPRSCATTSCARGFRDGTAGFLISVLNSYYVFLKILKLGSCSTGASQSGQAGLRRRRKFGGPGRTRIRSRGAERRDRVDRLPRPSLVERPRC